MSLNDPIADMLTRIRNALMAGKQSVQFESSKMKQQIIRILKLEGYIKSYVTQVHEDHKFLLIDLLYTADKKPVIRGLERLSKPGRRVYSSCTELPDVMNHYGTLIVSTSGGVTTGKKAKKQNMGGELICAIW